jgi:hypothetical protein
MRVRVRAVRAATGMLVAAAVLAATATSAAAAEDEGELVDVTKAVSSLEKKMDDLRLRGQQARKGELSASAVCGDAQAEQVFASWGDPSLYVPAAGGDAESLEDWSLNKHAGRGNNSPFSHGSSSLFLGEKGEAISPAMCVSVAHPTIRLFAVNTADEDSELEVEIYYEGLDGKVKKLKVAKLRGGAQWAPTTIVPVYVNMLGAAAEDGFTAIAIKFKAKDVKKKDAGWLIDDLYVDPLKTW